MGCTNACRKWWESFDNPTDTYLPGMRTGLDRRTGRNMHLPGQLLHGHGPLRPRSDPHLLRPALGRPVLHRPPHHYPYGFRLSDDDQERKVYFTYTLFDPSALVKFVLTPAGVEQELIWDATARAWRLIWAQPVAECELHNRCGAAGDEVCLHEGLDTQRRHEVGRRRLERRLREKGRLAV